jgi:hypothetical protein
MADFDIDADPPGWGLPLGGGLPSPGAPKIPWLLLSGALVLVLTLASGAACFAYPYVFPKVVLGTRVSQHATIREAALAWRSQLAKDPASALAMQVWKRGTASAGWCRSAAATDTDPGDYLLVKPSSEKDEGPSTVPKADRVVTLASSTWTPALKALAPQLQSGVLGGEQLTRGTVMVELKPAQSGAAVLVASSESPTDGHAGAGQLSLAPASGCLPLLGDAYANASLASPEPQAVEGGRYWVARTKTGVTLLKAAPCGAAGVEPLETRSYPAPATLYPLLTFSGTKPPVPHLLFMPSEGSDEAPLLLRAPSLNPSALEVVGPVNSNGINRAGGNPVPAADVFDSFQTGLPGANPGEALVAVRWVRDGLTRYLVKSNNGYTFDDCANPAMDRFYVIGDSCDQKKVGQYLTFDASQFDSIQRCRDVREPKPGAFDASLGPSPNPQRRIRTECVAERAYVHEEYDDVNCDLLITPARCTGGT